MHPLNLSRVTEKHTTDSSEDTEYQILSRISSLQTLDRCKVVCKSWYNIINEVPFMPWYCQNTRNLYGYILQTRKNESKFSKAWVSIKPRGNNLFPAYTKFNDFAAASVHKSYKNLKFDDEVEILASSMQGFVCCAKRDYAGTQLYVCKPTTGQWSPFPSPRPERDTIGLMMRSNLPFKYKIIWISSSYSDVDRGYKFWYETYDSATWKWSRRVELLLGFSWSRFIGQGIHVGNFLYFGMNTHILAIHGDDESIFQISYPNTISFKEDSPSPLFQRKLIEYQGKLSFICTTWPRLSSMQLWILEEHQKTGKWKIIKEVDLSFHGLGIVYPVGFYGVDILVLQGYESLIVCNFHDSTNYQFKPINFGSKYEIFPFRSDREWVEGYRSVVDLYKHVWWG